MDFSGEFRLQEILAFEKLFLKVLERRLESIFSFSFRKTRNAAVDVSAVFGVFVPVESFQPLFLCVFNNNRHVKIEQNRQDKQNKVRRKQKNSRADQKECAVNWISYNRIHAVCRKSVFLYMTFDFRLEIRITPKIQSQNNKNNSQNRERNSKCGNPCKGKEFFCADENSYRRKNNLRHDDNRTYSYDRKMFFIFFHLKTPIKRQKTSTVFYRISTRFLWKLQGSRQFFPQDFLRL